MKNNNEIKFEYGKKYIIDIHEAFTKPVIFLYDRMELIGDCGEGDKRFVFLNIYGDHFFINEAAAKYVKEYKEPVKAIERSVEGYVWYIPNAKPRSACSVYPLDILTGLYVIDQKISGHSESLIGFYRDSAAHPKAAKFRFTAVQLPDEE